MTYAAAVHAVAVDLVRSVLEMTTEAGSGHPSSAASLAHLTAALLYSHMRHDPRAPDHPRADRLVLSEGHACPVVYAAAADLGVHVRDTDGELRPMQRADALLLRAADSPIDGHPNPREGFPFFPAATGSLGQGLSVACGLGLAARLDGIDQRVFCIVGDGESREGQVWEAAAFLVEQSLRAVLPIFNCNGFGQTGAVGPQQSAEGLHAKLVAFGFDAEVVDGHDPDAIRGVLTEHARRCRDADGRPLALVARTVKGWGIPALQGDGHHGKPLAAEDLEAALADLERLRAELGAARDAAQLSPPPIPDVGPRPAPVARDAALPRDFAAAMRALGKAVGDRCAPRDAFGAALRLLGHARPELVVLDADVGDSTRALEFARDPDLADRWIECGIGEQNMMSCAVGLAAAGRMPFVSTFGRFLTRAFDQLEMGLLSGAPLKLVGSHVGVTPAADGPSQMALADVGYFRGLAALNGRDGRPLVHVLTPADATAAYALTLAMAAHDGACYLRTMRPEVPRIHADDAAFAIGGFAELTAGADMLVVAWGWSVHAALDAHELLRADGLQTTVVDAWSIPVDGPALALLAQRCNGRVLTVEDNFGGGLGSAVADAMAANLHGAAVEQMFVRRFPKSARSPEQETARLGLSAEHIAANVRRRLGR